MKCVLISCVACLLTSVACSEPQQNAKLRTPAMERDPNSMTESAEGSSGPTGGNGGGTTTNQTVSEGMKAVFIAAPKVTVSGEAHLVAVPEGVRIHVEVHGAAPGPKGMHIHQTADCSDIPNKSMGSHFSPEVTHHGLPDARHHHLGDLGNIEIDHEGKGTLDIVVAHANLTPNDPMSFLGRSVVLHEGMDNGTGESGESGHPIACAPINP